MPEDQLLGELHTRFALGEKLTPAEAEALAAWYIEQDQAEMDQLGRIKTADTYDLKVQLDSALRQLRLAVQRVHDLTAQNESLRQEITALQQQLQRTAQPQLA